LVSPVNVAERDLPAALAVVRAAASFTPVLSLRVGPVTTFQPVNPVAYLAVDGKAEAMEELSALRDSCLAGPLERRHDHDFVPHVTVAVEQVAGRLDAAVTALSDFSADVTFDRVHVLAEQPGHIWVPIAESPLGEEPRVVGRGSLPLEVAVAGRLDVEAAALLAIDHEPAGRPFSVTARRDSAVVGAAWGWTAGGRLEVADLVVAAVHRGQGIGRHLVAAVEEVGRARSCTFAGTAAPNTGAPAALLTGCGWSITTSPDAAPVAYRRWERPLHPAILSSGPAGEVPQERGTSPTGSVGAS
jgi:GNAT superfamily N-acetyltransferase